jgi:hypothetical protein
LEGGVKSGFRHVVKEQAALPTLLQIKVPIRSTCDKIA